MKIYTLAIATLLPLLTACSPPPPIAVDWQDVDMTQSPDVNRLLPNWRENYIVIPSDTTEGHWVKVIVFLEGPKILEPLDAYAIAHASRAVINANSGEGYFTVKKQLQEAGFTGKITYHPLPKDETPKPNYAVLIR